MTSKQLARNPILHVSSTLVDRIAKRFFPNASSRTLIGGPIPSESSKTKTGRAFVRRWNGLFKRRSRGRVTFDMLPDDVLLDIFDFYRMDFRYYPWRWHTLAHVCRRWRCLVFASPRSLDLQFLCTPRTPVRELLEFLPPAMPIMISNWSGSPPPYDPLSLEDGSQVLSAIEQRDRVRWLHLDGVTGSLLETLATKMQGTFPIMMFVRLWSDECQSDDDEMVPVLPEAFLGGSCPHLQTFWLYGVSFPHLPKLLLSANDLIVLRLENIPDSGYIPCEDMVASLSTSTKLETLTIEFQSTHLPHRDGTSQQPATSPLRVALPALTLFKFKGNGGYFDNFVVRCESHLLVPDFDQGWHEHNANRRLSYEGSYSPESGLRLHSESWIPQ